LRQARADAILDHMDPSLAAESEKLARSWLRHDAGMLRQYLVSGVEDPRLNLQSVLSRHFLVRELTGNRFEPLLEQECRFAAAMNCLVTLAAQLRDPEEPDLVLHALRRGGDNAEGIEIPQFVAQTFGALPAVAGEFTVPNYIQQFLSGLDFATGRAQVRAEVLDTFSRLWSRALAPLTREDRASRARDGVPAFPELSPEGPQPLTVLEPACGSANDFRFLHAYGIARLLDYTGFDLCPTNVINARTLFPGVRFEVGNVFELAVADKAFDLCFVHDLFEHLSLAGLRKAVAEICRVTRRGLCVGFFNLDEIGEHEVETVEEYHWNRLSMARMRELFAACGFTGQVLHIGTFLQREFGCEETHNPNAYTFVLEAL
jgi:hypothetical protein